MKPNFLFVATTEDYTAIKLHETALSLGYDSQFYFPLDLFHQPSPVPKLKTDHHTIAMFFWPFSPNKLYSQYQSLLEIILANYQFKYIFNEAMHSHSFLCYEDKLFQSYAFDKIGVPHAQNAILGDQEKIAFPIIAKKRVSSRSKNNFLISDLEEYTYFCRKNDISQYIFQRFFPLKADFRVIVFRGKVIGVVERKVSIKKNNRVTVKIVSGAQLPDQVLADCQKVSAFFSCELSGVDVGLREDGSYFIIEHNGRPQIVSSEKALGRNLTEEIIKDIAASPWQTSK